jgi:hypothetical protein
MANNVPIKIALITNENSSVLGVRVTPENVFSHSATILFYNQWYKLRF